jgi:hypothetical protein
MKNPWLWGIALLLAAIVAACFVWPQQLVAPGPVMPAHRAIAQDCFACHAPLRGASAARCIACHAPARIGLFTVAGTPLPKPSIAFHQQLQKADCRGCHSDHAGPALAGHGPTLFRHQLLQPAVQAHCAGCHVAPAGPRLGPLHKRFAAANCSACHSIAGWQPARFDHRLLAPAARAACVSCHARPSGALHRGFGTTNCATCHTTSAWEPASFDHDRWFRLDGDHKAACATCHTGGNLQRYTCYGCHEHQPSQMIAEHREEGVTNIGNCVRCHRSGDDDGSEGRREGGGDDDG